MSKRDWKLFLMDVLESIRKIEEYTEGMSHEEFVSDTKTVDAVVRNLEVIGEAASRIPKEIQQKYNEIPWAQIVSLRNRLIHGYFVVDYDIIWHIIENELPELKRNVEAILNKEKKNE